MKKDTSERKSFIEHMGKVSRESLERGDEFSRARMCILDLFIVTENCETIEDAAHEIYLRAVGDRSARDIWRFDTILHLDGNPYVTGTQDSIEFLLQSELSTITSVYHQAMNLAIAEAKQADDLNDK